MFRACPAPRHGDRDGARLVLTQLLGRFPRLQVIWADGACGGKLVEWAQRIAGWSLELVRRPAQLRTFQVLPRRWVVERTFGWLNLQRRLSKDYEALCETTETRLYISMTGLMLRRLAHLSSFWTPSKRVTIELADSLNAESSAFVHLGEKLPQTIVKLCRITVIVLTQLRQYLVRQKPYVLGKKAEHEPVQETGNLQRINTPLPHQLGNSSENLRRLFSNFIGTYFRFQRIGVVKDAAEYGQRFRFAQIVQQDGMDYGHLVSEVGVDPDGPEVGYYQDRRVVQRLAVAQ